MDVILMSRSGEFPDFPQISHDWVRKGTISLEGGNIYLRTCASVRYDTHVKRGTESVAAFCTEDDYYFYKTHLVIQLLERG